jgi:hypothetical protein
MEFGLQRLTYDLLIIWALLHTFQDRKLKKTRGHLSTEAKVIVVRASIEKKSIIKAIQLRDCENAPKRCKGTHTIQGGMLVISPFNLSSSSFFLSLLSSSSAALATSFKNTAAMSNCIVIIASSASPAGRLGGGGPVGTILI